VKNNGLSKVPRECKWGCGKTGRKPAPLYWADECVGCQHRRHRLGVVILLGGQCSSAGCQYKDIDGLVIDHINEDGHLDRNPGGSRVATTIALRRDVRAGEDIRSIYQLLCPNHHEEKNRKKKVGCPAYAKMKEALLGGLNGSGQGVLP
jgi:hypothetical protein